MTEATVPYTARRKDVLRVQLRDLSVFIGQRRTGLRSHLPRPRSIDEAIDASDLIEVRRLELLVPLAGEGGRDLPNASSLELRVSDEAFRTLLDLVWTAVLELPAVRDAVGKWIDVSKVADVEGTIGDNRVAISVKFDLGLLGRSSMSVECFTRPDGRLRLEIWKHGFSAATFIPITPLLAQLRKGFARLYVNEDAMRGVEQDGNGLTIDIGEYLNNSSKVRFWWIAGGCLLRTTSSEFEIVCGETA